jgi:hypothetical protein
MSRIGGFSHHGAYIANVHLIELNDWIKKACDTINRLTAQQPESGEFTKETQEQGE